MKSSSADFHVQRLEHDTTLCGPELLQGQNESLKSIQISSFVHGNAE
jgi:hypothetical protein